MISEKLTAVGAKAGDPVLTGIAAAAASGAPIGDLAKLIGDNLLHGIGFRPYDHHGRSPWPSPSLAQP